MSSDSQQCTKKPQNLPKKPKKKPPQQKRGEYFLKKSFKKKDFFFPQGVCVHPGPSRFLPCRERCADPNPAFIPSPPAAFPPFPTIGEAKFLRRPGRAGIPAFPDAHSHPPGPAFCGFIEPSVLGTERRQRGDVPRILMGDAAPGAPPGPSPCAPHTPPARASLPGAPGMCPAGILG